MSPAWPVSADERAALGVGRFGAILGPLVASALVAAGGMGFRDAVGIVQKRGRYMSEAVAPGTGLVAALLGLAADVVKEVCREAGSVGVVQAANFNSPGQVVIAGEKAAVERAIELSEEKYCSVRGMLGPQVEVVTSYRVEEATGPEGEASSGE